MNMVGEVVNGKYYGITHTEKVDLVDFVSFYFLRLSFYMKQVKCRIIKLAFSQN